MFDDDENRDRYESMMDKLRDFGLSKKESDDKDEEEDSVTKAEELSRKMADIAQSIDRRINREIDKVYESRPESPEMLGKCLSESMLFDIDDKAKFYYEKLLQIDISQYGFEALKARAEYELVDPVFYQESLVPIITRLKENYSEDEEGWLMEAVFEEKLKHYDKACELLETAKDNVRNPSQIVKKLIELRRKRGEYSECHKLIMEYCDLPCRSDDLSDQNNEYEDMFVDLERIKTGELLSRVSQGTKVDETSYLNIIRRYEELLGTSRYSGEYSSREVKDAIESLENLIEVFAK